MKTPRTEPGRSYQCRLFYNNRNGFVKAKSKKFENSYKACKRKEIGGFETCERWNVGTLNVSTVRGGKLARYSFIFCRHSAQ